MTDLKSKEFVNFVDFNKKDRICNWQESWVKDARDRLHNLDISKDEHYRIYDSHLKVFIMFNEVFWSLNNDGIPIKPKIPLKVYKDSNNYSTIGIGFNMDDKNAKTEWNNVFCGNIPFDDVIHGKISIREEQAYKLFSHSIKIRIMELKLKFGNYWDIFKPNEKLSIISLYYNHPALIGVNFSSYIKKYVETSYYIYLKKVVYDVRYGSNRTKKIGVQIRRDRESLMLESYKCPICFRPPNSLIPQNCIINAEVCKTIIPRFDGKNTSKNNEYYILRVKDINQISPLIQFYDGKIFHIERPPDILKNNDKCYIKDFNIPDFVRIKDKSEEKDW